MLMDGIDATSLAFEAGYESVSQFTPILSFPARSSPLSNEDTLDEKLTHASGGQVG
jgi:hypothetical protein